MKRRIIFRAFAAIFIVSSLDVQFASGGGRLPESIDIHTYEDVLSFDRIPGYVLTKLMAVNDINKDGYDDLILKCGTGDSEPVRIGIVFGKADFMDTDIQEYVSNEALILIPAIVARYRIIDKIITGDFNGDRFVDLVHRNDADFGVLIIKGNPNWQNIVALSQSDIIKIGGSVASNFDAKGFNGDGIDDLVIANSVQGLMNLANIGVTNILYGDRGLEGAVDINSSAFRRTNIKGDTLYSGAFGDLSIGDIDGDLRPDLFASGGVSREPFLYSAANHLSKFWNSRDYFLYGSVLTSPVFAGEFLDLMIPRTGVTVVTTYSRLVENRSSGANIDTYDLRNSTAIGDINADGYDDLFLAYHYLPDNYGQTGVMQSVTNDYPEMYIYWGKNDFYYSGDIRYLSHDRSKLRSIIKDNGMGFLMSFGDINGDGYDDLLISNADESFNIMWGGEREEFADSMLVETGSEKFISAIGGSDVLSGDINGDGYDDILGNSKSKGVFIFPGKGELLSIGEPISKRLPRSSKSSYAFAFEYGPAFHFTFTKGRPDYTTNLILTNYGKTLPDSLSNIPLGDGVGILALLEAELTDMISSYIIKCSFSYSDSMLAASNIAEEDLAISYWDEAIQKWAIAPMERDTVSNRVSFSTDHLSLWALVDKNNPVVTSIREENAPIPEEFALFQNYPNPFNPVTTIRYQVPGQAKVSLKIYNILGQEVRTLVNGPLPAGDHEIEWNGTDNSGRPVSSGIYIYRMTTDAGFTATRKLVVMK